MAGASRGLFREQVHTLFESGTVVGLTDGQLLERFATRRGEASELAFTALVERHGPMVLRACRGVLRDDHEAMDAFQATFLVLARKGGSLWVRDSLGPWLHRVACRAAGRARRDAERWRASERKAAEMAKPRIPDADVDREETAAAIHEEVDRLPERYRAAVVLCDLEGRTCEDAARHLGCPVGTVGSRLARGRERLRDRLARRGLASGVLAWQGPIEPIPPELVGATVAAAARFASSQAASQGAAAFLALGVLRAVTMTTCLKVATVLLAAGASTSGLVAIAGKGQAAAAAGRPDDPPQAAKIDADGTVVVRRGKFDITVRDRARLEASRSDDVYSPIEGQTTILSILPEGTRVKKGDLVCELDSAALRDALTNQRIATQSAEAAYRKAMLTREVAEIARKEYTEGILLSEHEVAAGAVRLAESALKAAQERLKRTQAARERLKRILAISTPSVSRVQPGPITAVEVVTELDLDDRIASAELDIDRQRASLEVKQSQLNLLNNYTKVKVVTQLSAEMEQARLAEQAARSAFGLENDKSKHLERQIKNCKLYAPNDGVLVYADDPVRAAGWPSSRIEEGAAVRERQRIFSLPELTKFRAVAHFHESAISQIRPGQAARVRVDAFPNETLAGVVEAVFPLPDPPRSADSDGKYYTTRVLIEKSLPGLQPGMTASVWIVVGADDVLSVPGEAVAVMAEKNHVAVKKPDGEVEWREVKLGRGNDKEVEVKEGLKPGETIVVAPEKKPSGFPRYDETKPAGKTPGSEGGGR